MSFLVASIEEEDLPKLIGFLKRQETNGKFFSKAMKGMEKPLPPPLHFLHICKWLCQIGGAVESVLGCPIEEEDLPKLIGFLKRQ